VTVWWFEHPLSVAGGETLQILPVDDETVLAEDVDTGEVAVGHRLPAGQTDE
jgi:hypothetical protein